MRSAGQMTLTLTDDLEQFVREQTRKGAFASNSEYVRTLIRERYFQEREREERRQSIDAAITKGLSDAESGRVTPVDEVFTRLRSTLAEERARRG
ncbi:type II toxin-antitoxin system ParD family antitoxin [Aliihoeflea aestuarii]|nr:type II toxin-antitoxin system ParD family antitoxin [Aliihoeflea aestuarii]